MFNTATTMVHHWKQCYITVLMQCSGNVCMLCECWYQHWNPTKLQCSGNVLWMMVPNIEIWSNNHIQAMLSWHCGNIENLCNFHVVTTFRQYCANQNTNIHTTLYQHWENKSFSALPQLCYNIGRIHQELQIWFPISITWYKFVVRIIILGKMV